MQRTTGRLKLQLFAAAALTVLGVRAAWSDATYRTALCGACERYQLDGVNGRIDYKSRCNLDDGGNYGNICTFRTSGEPLDAQQLGCTPPVPVTGYSLPSGPLSPFPETSTCSLEVSASARRGVLAARGMVTATGTLSDPYNLGYCGWLGGSQPYPAGWFSDSITGAFDSTRTNELGGAVLAGSHPTARSA